MERSGRFFVAALFLGSAAAMEAQDNTPAARKKLPDGIYAVHRESLKEMDVLPVKENEVMAVHHHRYLKKGENQPPQFLVVHSGPDIVFDLAGEPTVKKEGDEVVRILLKLQPKAATALERLTRDHLGRPIAIILDGEVVTMHKIRDVIKDGNVQITGCAPVAVGYLVKQLEAYQKKK